MGREETGDTSSALVRIFWPTHSAWFVLYTIVGNLQLEAVGHLFFVGYYLQSSQQDEGLDIPNETPRFQSIFKFFGSVFFEKQTEISDCFWTQLWKKYLEVVVVVKSSSLLNDGVGKSDLFPTILQLIYALLASHVLPFNLQCNSFEPSISISNYGCPEGISTILNDSSISV